MKSNLTKDVNITLIASTLLFPLNFFNTFFPPRFILKMDAELLHSPVVGSTEDEEVDVCYWNLQLAFMKKRHTEKIEGSKALAQSWRMKDRVRGCALE